MFLICNACNTCIQNGEILDTWDGRVSPLGEELLNIVADRLNFKKLHQGARLVGVHKERG